MRFRLNLSFGHGRGGGSLPFVINGAFGMTWDGVQMTFGGVDMTWGEF